MALIAGGLSGCGSGGTSDPAPTPAPTPTPTPIGPAGGTASIADGAGVVVPPDALGSSVAITVAPSTASAPAGATSRLYEFGPAETSFGMPVTVQIPVDAGTSEPDVALYWTRPGSSTEYDALAMTLSGTTASASVFHFSRGYVGRRPTQCPDVSGGWTFETHCQAGYVGQTLNLTQAACAIAATDPVNGLHANGFVSGGRISIGACQGSVSGTTIQLSCGPCAQTLSRVAQCTAGQACTPTGAAVACKAYATACDAGGQQSCGVSGNQPDGTLCGVGATCQAGTCAISGSGSYGHSTASRRQLLTPTGSATYTQRDEALEDAAATWTRLLASSNATTYQVRTFTGTGDGVSLSQVVTHLADGTTQSTTTYAPPLLILPADVTPGTTTSTTSTATTGASTVTVTRRVTIDGPELVTVPAGTFSALRTTTYVTQSNAAPTNVLSWWVRGIGQVKVVTAPAATPSAPLTQELTGYSPMDCTGGTCACNALVNGAPTVNTVFVPAELPAATGGALLDGTYYLTANNVYSGPGGTSGPSMVQMRNTYGIGDGFLQYVGWRTGQVGDSRSTARYVATGSQVTATTTCGEDTLGGTVYFTASGNQVRMIVPNPSYPASSSDRGGEAVLARQ